MKRLIAAWIFIMMPSAAFSSDRVSTLYQSFPWMVIQQGIPGNIQCSIGAIPENKSNSTFVIRYFSKTNRTIIFLKKATWHAGTEKHANVLVYTEARDSTALNLNCIGDACGSQISEDNLAEIFFQAEEEPLEIRFKTGSETPWLIKTNPSLKYAIDEWKKCRSENSETSQPF